MPKPKKAANPLATLGELIWQARKLGLKSLVWADKGDDKSVCAAAWPYVGYGATEEEALTELIGNIEAKKEYNK